MMSSSSNKTTTSSSSSSTTTSSCSTFPKKTTTTTKLPWQSALAGYVAGVSGVIIGHPLDSAKVWLQTNSVGMNQHLLQKQSSATNADAAPPSKKKPSSSSPSSSLVRTIRALYSGVSVPLVTVGIVQSINFAIYDSTRRYLYYSNADETSSATSNSYYLHHDPLPNVALAGFVSGAGLAFCTSPIILLKTKQQITGKTFAEALQQTFLSRKGKTSSSQLRHIASTYLVGFVPHLVCETIGRAIYYSTYEYCKRKLLLAQQQQQQSTTTTTTTSPAKSRLLSIPETMLCAGFAGIVCWAAIFPMDSLRNRMYHQHVVSVTKTQTQTPTPSKQLSTIQMAIRMIVQERSLYRGFIITVLRAGPVASIILPIYDRTLEYLLSRNAILNNEQ